MTARLRPGDLVVFLGPSLSAAAARRIAPCRVLPPARAGDVVAILPERPLAIALVDGLFDTTPSVWHHELLAALDAGVAVFGGASMGALRAAELSAQGVVGVGRVFRGYRDGALVDDAEVALLHAGPEHAFRPLSLPLVQVRAAAEAARAQEALSARAARALVETAAAVPYGDRTWPAVLDAAGLEGEARERLQPILAAAPDVKAEDARECIAAAAEFARARRAGAPPPPAPAVGPPSSQLRRLRLRRARSVLPGGEAVPSGEVLDALARRPDAGRLAADGLRRALVAALARSMGLAATAEEVERAERSWLARLGVAPRGAATFLAACGLDASAARRLAEDLALEARLLALAERAVPDGPSWEEGLALEARLTGAWAATRPPTSGQGTFREAKCAPAAPHRLPARSSPRPARRRRARQR